MAPYAQRLPIGHVVPLATLADSHHVIGVCLPLVAAHAPAVAARPSVTGEHSLTPCPVCLVAVTSSRRIGSVRIVTLAAYDETHRLMRWDAAGH